MFCPLQFSRSRERERGEIHARSTKESEELSNTGTGTMTISPESAVRRYVGVLAAKQGTFCNVSGSPTLPTAVRDLQLRFCMKALAAGIS